MLCQHCPPRSITWANHLNLSEQNFSPSLKSLSQSRCKLFCGKSFCRTVVGRNRSIILGGASVERGCRRLRLVFLFAELSELFCCVGNLARAFLFYSAYHVFMCVCYSVWWILASEGKILSDLLWAKIGKWVWPTTTIVDAEAVDEVFPWGFGNWKEEECWELWVK